MSETSLLLAEKYAIIASLEAALAGARGEIQKLRAALREALVTFHVIDRETCTCGIDYGIPRVAKMAALEAKRCSAALGHPV